MTQQVPSRLRELLTFVFGSDGTKNLSGLQFSYQSIVVVFVTIDKMRTQTWEYSVLLSDDRYHQSFVTGTATLQTGT